MPNPTKKFTSTFELTISPENTALIPLMAEEFWWFPEMTMTPEEVIQRHFEHFYLECRNKIQNRLMRLKWEAGRAEVEAIMNQYDESASSNTSFLDI